MRHPDEPHGSGVSGTARRVPYGYEQTDDPVEPEAGVEPSEWPEGRDGALYRVEVRRDHLGREPHHVVLFAPGVDTYEALVERERACSQTELVSVRAVEESAAVSELATFERHGQSSYEGVVEWVRTRGRTGKPTLKGC
jgi:hypothetical protein